MDLNFTNLYHSIQEKNVKHPGLETGHFRDGKYPFSGVGFGLEKMERVQVWEQGIFGVGNARFRGWDLALENGTCTGHFPEWVFLISGPKITSSTTCVFCLLKTRI